jgi:sterol desaturase/sphingolipid hydroxylase (fatty acid hydroxylase superfamily)
VIWNLIGKAQRSWWHFKSSKPGDRFQVRYYRRQQSAPGRLSTIFNIVVGSILVIFSAFFGWAPGPGLLTFLIGLALIGGEFLTIARFLDWSEVWLRKLAHLVGVVWRSSKVGKVVVVLVALILVFAFGYVVYSVLFGG